MTAQTNSIANNVAGAVMEVIRTRRTVREFSPQPVPRELIDQIVEAGDLGAQSSTHRTLAFHSA